MDSLLQPLFDAFPWVETYVWPTVVLTFLIVSIIIIVLLCVAYLTLAERRVMAAMQLCLGPMVVGPFGQT